MSRENLRSALEEALAETDDTQETAPPVEQNDPPAVETPPPATPEADPEEGTGLPAAEVETPPEPKGTKETLAEKGVDIKELYEMKVPGTELTFGQLKDAAPDIADVSRLKLDIQKQSDELVAEKATTNQEALAVMQRLAAKFGEADVLAAAGQAESDVAANRQAQRDQLIRFRPELTEPGKLDEAFDQMAQVGRVYGITRPMFESTGAGVQRMALRLHTLEGYLDTLRESEPTPKQVRGKNVQAAAPRGKTENRSQKFSHRGTNQFHDRMKEAMKQQG